MKWNSSQIILEKLQTTLTSNEIDFEKIINDLGQAKASKKRDNDYQFTLKDHVKGLILSLLSNQRPWEPIARNLDNLGEIFLNYDPEKLENADPEELVDQIKDIKCGNRNINKQMNSISYNIQQLRKLEQNFGDLDTFVTHKPPEEVADILTNSKSQYKIKQMGMALAMEYLKNVGVSGVKPDTHLIRICGPKRLDIIPANNAQKQIILFEKFAKDAGVNTTYLDNLFWIFGAENYGEICSKTPKCHKCELTDYCNYKKNTIP